MHDAQAGKIAVLRAEWTIQNAHVLNQFRSQALQLPEVPLPMTLRPLILLNIVDQHFQAAVDSSVIQVEAKSPDLQRFPAAFVLACVDSGIESLKYLIVSRKKRSLINRVVAAIYAWIESGGCDDDALVNLRNDECDLDS